MAVRLQYKRWHCRVPLQGKEGTGDVFWGTDDTARNTLLTPYFTPFHLHHRFHTWMLLWLVPREDLLTAYGLHPASQMHIFTPWTYIFVLDVAHIEAPFTAINSLTSRLVLRLDRHVFSIPFVLHVIFIFYYASCAQLSLLHSAYPQLSACHSLGPISLILIAIWIVWLRYSMSELNPEIWLKVRSVSGQSRFLLRMRCAAYLLVFLQQSRVISRPVCYLKAIHAVFVFLAWHHRYICTGFLGDWLNALGNSPSWKMHLQILVEKLNKNSWMRSMPMNSNLSLSGVSRVKIFDLFTCT